MSPGTGRLYIVTLVERVTGFVMIGRLANHTVAALNPAAIRLIAHAPIQVLTITADNGTEFHGYPDIEAATGVRFYFATPHHSWERGTSENTNGLIRQYIPKRSSMARPLPSRLRSNRLQAQRSTQETPRLPLSQGVLMTQTANKPCCTSNLILEDVPTPPAVPISSS